MKKVHKDLLFVLNEDNPYIILGVSENADNEHISQVFRTLAKRYHPDKFSSLKGTPDFEEIQQVFQKLANAYNLLKDSEERKKFDYTLQLKKARQQANYQPGSPVVSNIFAGRKNTGDNSGNNQHNGTDTGAKGLAYSYSMLEQAKKYIDLKNFDEAITLLKVISEKHPKEAPFHSYFGLALKGKGWDGYAQAEFKVALHYDPKDKVALLHYKPSGSKKSPEKNPESTKGFLGSLKSLFNK